MNHFLKAIPVLYSSDIDRTVDFYHHRLHFDLVYKRSDFAIMARENLTIHFNLLLNKAERARCYIEVKGIDHLYKEMRMAGVVHPDFGLVDQDWDMREFAILDNDGNTIRFGESLPLTPRA